MTNTGQMLMVLGALLLFTMMIPSMNESLLYNDTTLITNNCEMTAVSLAQRILAEAQILDFDEATINKRLTTTTKLTAITSLGPESGEIYPNFDDVDDFNDVTIIDSTTFPSVNFTISAVVEYMDETDPSDVAIAKSFLKRLRVSVTSPFMRNPNTGETETVTLEQIYGYF